MEPSREQKALRKGPRKNNFTVGRLIVSFCGMGFALRFGSDLVVTIERGQRNSLSYFEGLAIEERPKMTRR